MSDIRNALLRFHWLFEQQEGDACWGMLSQLEERFGTDIVPGLIECLTDWDGDIRFLSVGLLAAARPRSNVAVPALIACLKDEVHRVRVAVVQEIAEFGPIAAAAIPTLEMWFALDDEYLRILARIAIARGSAGSSSESSTK